jgi:hypothetical protein
MNTAIFLGLMLLVGDISDGSSRPNVRPQGIFQPDNFGRLLPSAEQPVADLPQNTPDLLLGPPTGESTEQSPFGTSAKKTQRPPRSTPGLGSGQDQGERSRYTGGGQPAAGGAQQSAKENLIPEAPTKSANFSSPTDASNESSNYGTPMSNPLGLSPYRQSSSSKQRPTASHQTGKTSGSALVQQQQQAARLDMMLPKAAAPSRTTKPFSGYTPSPTVSPYLNLFRNSNSDVNNYTTLVQPYLQQEQQTRVIGGEIRGLQSAARVQTSVLQKLGKRTETVGGTTAPEFYQNYKDFFPGFNR